MSVPKEIDSALVIQACLLTSNHVSTGFTTHHAEGFEKLDRLAICKYDGEGGYYLFYCDSNWHVLNDTFHDSLEFAIEQAELEFTGTIDSWSSIQE